MDPVTSIRSIHLHYIICILQKSFCILISVHSLSIVIVVFTEAFPAPPVLIHAHYSRLNFAMLGVAMLKDVPRQFYVWGMFKNFCQKFGQLCHFDLKDTKAATS